MRTHRIAGVLGVLALAVAVLVTGCGNDDEGRTVQVSATEHNDADVAFASRMIQHHAQGVALAGLALRRTVDPEVEGVAEDILASRGAEIETMADWLQGWGEEVPATMNDHAHGDDHAGAAADDTGADLPGMVPADDLAELENAPDGEFQDRWLAMMIDHHRGAVELAATQLAEGRYEPAVALADDIVGLQTAEIETMVEIRGS